MQRARALTGTALSGARRRPPFAILTPVQPAEDSRTRGPNDTPAARYGSGQESQCLRDQLDPVLGQKSRRAGSKDGLAARGESKAGEKSGTASQFASGQVLCFEGHDGRRIGGSPHFSLSHDLYRGLLGVS